MNSIYLVVDLLFAGCGVYVLYAYFMMTKKGEIKENILMSKEVTIKHCKDKEGYIKYMAPKVLIFGIILVVIGILGFADDYFKFMGMASLILQFLGLAAIIYFAIVSKNSIKKFW